MHEEQRDFFSSSEPTDLVRELLQKAKAIYIKKLSVNDRSWARDPSKHQSGIYVSPTDRDCGFFPKLIRKDRPVKLADILEAHFKTYWPAQAVEKDSHLVNYTSKGPETHLTRVPKEAFADLAPASFIVIGTVKDKYECITIDAESDDYTHVIDLLSLPPDFKSGVFTLAKIEEEREEKTLSFVDEVLKAYFEGNMNAITGKYGAMPSTPEIAHLAQAEFLKINDLKSLNPMEMSAPGDAVRTISRGIEYEIFKELQMRTKVVDLIHLIVGDNPKLASTEKTVTTIIREYQKIYSLFLSAAQSRKSRAGYSFEHHIERLLVDGNVPHEKQVVLEAKQRPDFILPSLKIYRDSSLAKEHALVLSAKTTLRERWKQVHGEMKGCDLYLATVDESIAGNAIEDMKSQGIFLVVPEELKTSSVTEYKKQSNVIDFKTFFSKELAKVRLPKWQANLLLG